MAPTEEKTFTARELLDKSGIGSSGDQLVRAFDDHYPPELTAALERTANEELTDELDDDDYARAKQLTGLDDIRGLRVRGGTRTTGEAIVTYAAITADGDVTKGAFSYADLKGTGKPKDPIYAQHKLVNEGDTAARWREENRHDPDADTAPPVDDNKVAELAAENQRLEAEAKAERDAKAKAEREAQEAREAREAAEAKLKDPEPVPGYDKATVPQIAKALAETDRPTLDRVEKYELAHEDRQGVKDAVAKRRAELDAQDAEVQRNAGAADLLADRDAEIERLKAELQAKSQPAAETPDKPAAEAPADKAK